MSKVHAKFFITICNNIEYWIRYFLKKYVSVLILYQGSPTSCTNYNLVFGSQQIELKFHSTIWTIIYFVTKYKQIVTKLNWNYKQIVTKYHIFRFQFFFIRRLRFVFNLVPITTIFWATFWPFFLGCYRLEDCYFSLFIRKKYIQ